jgi:hypothetical protein
MGALPNDAATDRLLAIANAATTVEVLPDSRTSHVVTPKGAIDRGVLGFWVPVFCASCGADGGLCPEENMTFMFFLCTRCYGLYGDIAGTYAMPDEIFFARVRELEAQTFGRSLTLEEQIEQLRNPDSAHSKLARDRASLTVRM